MNTDLNDYYFLDVEATGLYLDDDITQLSVIISDSNLNLKDYRNYYMNTDKILSAEVVRVTGLTNKNLLELSGGLDFNHYAEEISELLNGKILIAHNSEFDLGMIKSNLKRCGLDFKVGREIDTMSRYLNMMKLPNFRGMNINGYKPPRLEELVDFSLKENGEDKENLISYFRSTFPKEVAHISENDVNINSYYHNSLFDTYGMYYAFCTLK